jgi:hypothetical protein
MKAGFNIDGIPKTFRDAILVTRAIGIRYLWIDSLCIIQGDASDWQSEGGKMADVYSSALLTISAANSNGDSQGFLAPRRFEYMRVVVSAGPDLSATAYLHKKSYWNDHNQEPLDARAWTLQEQYLSSRNVRYCGKEMSWRCRTSAWNESAIDNGYFREWERPWTDLVEEFSRRILTYDSDRLTAMAGVASSVAQRNGNIYCAGVWLQNMPDELLFERKDAKSPSEYIAPSWSWAALNGPVVFVPPRLDCYCPLSSVKILRYDIQTSAENRFGRLRGRGYLELQAHIIHLERTRCLENASTPHYQLKHSRSRKLGDNVVIRCKFDSSDLGNQEFFALILAHSVAVPAPGAPLLVRNSLLPTPGALGFPFKPWDPVVKDTQMSLEAPQEWDGLYGILICDASESLQPLKPPLRAGLLGTTKEASLLQYKRCGFFEITGLKGEQGPQVIADHPIHTVLLY